MNSVLYLLCLLVFSSCQSINSNNFPIKLFNDLYSGMTNAEVDEVVAKSKRFFKKFDLKKGKSYLGYTLNVNGKEVEAFVFFLFEDKVDGSSFMCKYDDCQITLDNSPCNSCQNNSLFVTHLSKVIIFSSNVEVEFNIGLDELINFFSEVFGESCGKKKYNGEFSDIVKSNQVKWNHEGKLVELFTYDEHKLQEGQSQKFFKLEFSKLNNNSCQIEELDPYFQRFFNLRESLYNLQKYNTGTSTKSTIEDLQ
ncbi:MAG: hypothetical protein P1U70_25040 [Saprospiraceae bacterium]|nr:hypothetical protein [Saprospiraceae bacterium]